MAKLRWRYDVTIRRLSLPRMYQRGEDTPAAFVQGVAFRFPVRLDGSLEVLLMVAQ